MTAHLRGLAGDRLWWWAFRLGIWSMRMDPARRAVEIAIRRGDDGEPGAS
jgi:hypothetical protein